MSEGGDFKNNDLRLIYFDTRHARPYYTRPMAPGLPDRVDCARLADEGAVLERVLPLATLPRLRDLLAESPMAEGQGSVAAKYEFATLSSGRPGATVTVDATVWLTCQRCLQGFAFPVAARSEIEFAPSEFAAGEAAESQREVYAVSDGLVSLRQLAEEELLLALPIVAACVDLKTCGRALGLEPAGEVTDLPGDRSRPFAVLQELLKKT
jgi:uncharacterized protein